MKYYRFPENLLSRFAFTLFFFITLLLVRDTLITTCILGFYKATFISYALFALVGAFFLWWNRKRIKLILMDDRILLILAVTVVSLLPMLVKQDWQLMYISILVCILIPIFISLFKSHNEVALIYVRILLVLSVYSLFALFALKYLADLKIITVSEFTNSVDRPFYNFGLAYVTAWKDYTRNFGVFREPGVYQFFLILAIYLNNWKIEWNEPWKNWVVNMVLAITVLTTQSTNGVVELALLVGIMFFDKKWYKNKVICFAFISIVFAIICVIVYSLLDKCYLYDYIRVVFGKLFSSTNSKIARIESIVVDTKFFLSNPIFGEKISTVLYAVTDNTSSTMILFAIYGIAGGLLHVASWVALVWDKNRHSILNLGLLATMFMSFNTQNLTWDIMFWLFPMMALTEKVVPWLEEKFPRKC